MDKNHQKTTSFKTNMNLKSGGETGSGSGRGTVCSVASSEYFKKITNEKINCRLRSVHVMNQGRIQ